MPQPGQEIIIAGPLKNVSIAYRNRLYVADSVFPLIPNVPLEAKMARYLKGAWFRDEAMMRGPGGEAGRGGYPVDYLDIILKEFAYAKEVTDEDRQIAAQQNAAPLQPDQDAVEFATDKINLKREVRVANLVKLGVWSSIAAGGTDAGGAWAAGAGNTFLADVKAKKALIQKNTGFNPNALLIDNGTYMSLTEEATVLDKIKYTQKGVLTKELLAAILDLDEVIVAGAVISTAVEKKAGTDFTAALIWEVNAGKGMGFLFYRPPAPGLKMPSAGYIARGGDTQGFSAGMRLTTWREASRHQDVYEAAEKLDIVATGLDLGYMWKDTLLT
jgi:hypothetical protein